MPTLADFDSVFAHPLPAAFFPSFVVPPAIPSPSTLSRMARAIYPHWQKRRTLSEGKQIIPQLNVSLRPSPDTSKDLVLDLRSSLVRRIQRRRPLRLLPKTRGQAGQEDQTYRLAVRRPAGLTPERAPQGPAAGQRHARSGTSQARARPRRARILGLQGPTLGPQAQGSCSGVRSRG